MYNTNNQIKFKTTTLKSILCNSSDTHILVEGTISVATATGEAVSNSNKKLMFENLALFTDCISEINNIQVDNAKDINVAMSICTLI